MKSDIEKFFRFLQLEKSLATNSIDAYQHDIARYAAFLEARGIASANGATGDDVAAFIHELHRLGLSARSVARNLSAVKSFHKFLLGEKVTASDPTLTIELPKRGKFLPDVLSVGEINKIIDATSQKKDDDKNLWIRDRAILETLYATGMRVGETLRLDRGDVDLDDGLLVVRDSKFGKSREVPLHKSAVKALRSYAERRDELCPQASTDAFFLSATGTRVLYCNFHLAFLSLVREAGLRPRSPKCRPRPHDLRH